MKIGNDECELVTDFATLRAGMIVWIKPCRWAGHSAHRVMLIGPTISTSARGPAGDISYGAGFECLPKPSCCTARRRLVMSCTVADGIVYRIVDPKLAQTTERKREAVRP